MSRVEFVFTSFDYDTGHLQIKEVDVPASITNDLYESFPKIPKDHGIAFTFNIGACTFCDGDRWSIVKFFLLEMPDALVRQVVGEDETRYTVSYILTPEVKKRLESFTMDSLIFLGALLHTLNLKKYLLPVVSVLMDRYAMEFQEIKTTIKKIDFAMDIYLTN